jgi:phospholipid-binding lipoprotein MlaA
MRRSIALASSALVLVSSLAGTARAATPEDPWESANRARYDAHGSIDRNIILPLAKLYHALTPGIIGQGIHNVLVELSEPMTFANDVLQARPKRATRTAARFAVNALAGFGGLIDVAAKGNTPHRDNDFGITLGVWGMKPGPYLFAPLLGPTTVRDLAGTFVELVADPRNYVAYRSHLKIDLSTAVAGALDKRDRAEADLQTLLRDSADPYATLRSAYLQDRQANVEDREAPPADLPDIQSAPTDTGAPPPPSPDGTTPSPENTQPPPAGPAPAPAPQAAAPTAGTLASADLDAPMTTAGGDRAPRETAWREASL